jgi:predicted histidine transporter YuiF (NhaC family)
LHQTQKKSLNKNNKQQKMSDENNKPSEDEKKNVPIAEVLIATGIQLAQEKNMSLGELVGHYEIAKIEVYNRITAGAKAAAQNSGPVGDVGTEGTAGASQDEDEGKA